MSAAGASPSPGLFWANRQRPEVAFFAYSVAAVETVIAVAVMLGRASKLTCICAAAFSVLIWAVAEELGGPYTCGAAGTGTGIIYAVVLVGLPGLTACRRTVSRATGGLPAMARGCRQGRTAGRRLLEEPNV